MDRLPTIHAKTVKKEPEPAEGFSIRDIKVLLAGKDMVQDLHRHDYFHVLALKKGMGNHEADFTSYEFCDKSLFFMRPGQVHQVMLKAESTGYLMEFKTDFYTPPPRVSKMLMCKTMNKNLCHQDAKRFQKLFYILTYVFREYTDKHAGYHEAIQAVLDVFFLELVRHRHNRKSLPDNNTPYVQERFEEFSELLEIHISNTKHVSKYADMMHLSPYQLNAITKAAQGKTCSELINDHIILEAKRQLLATSSLVNQIAYHLGYEDISYFIRFFKSHTGYTPESFRNSFK
jgi:AraC family transcriptional regulator, transcriptional activator of pobA